MTDPISPSPVVDPALPPTAAGSTEPLTLPPTAATDTSSSLSDTSSVPLSSNDPVTATAVTDTVVDTPATHPVVDRLQAVTDELAALINAVSSKVLPASVADTVSVDTGIVTDVVSKLESLRDSLTPLVPGIKHDVSTAVEAVETEANKLEKAGEAVFQG